MYTLESTASSVKGHYSALPSSSDNYCLKSLQIHRCLVLNTIIETLFWAIGTQFSLEIFLNG